MSLSTDTDATDHAVRTLLQNALGLTAPLNTNIHENDQMFSYSASARGNTSTARSEYFTSGAQLLKVLEQIVAWKFGSLEKVSSFLDFASGYGRLTRFLVHELPADRIWVSDIQAEAVAFQEAEFGVPGFVSTADPADLVCDRTFDTILVASLFSHLPPATFTSWLHKLYSLLNPGGLLIFSVHGESLMLPGHTMPDSGIWFDQTSEIASTEAKEYGVSIVTETYVRNAIVAATGQTAYKRIELGLLYQQDLYLVANGPAADFSDLDFHYVPHGAMDHALWAGPGELYLKGWAADITGPGSPVEVQVFVDEQLQQSSITSEYRPDLREHFKDDRFSHTGWEYCCQLADNDSTRSVLIKVISTTGAESILYAGPIASLLPVGRVEFCVWTAPDELYLKGWAVGIAADDSPVEVQVFVSGRLIQECVTSNYRPELREHFKADRFLYAGWVCFCHLPGGDHGQVITVKSISAAGTQSILCTGTIASLLPMTGLDTIALPSEFEERRRQLTAELDIRLEYIRHLEAEVARKDAALAEIEARTRRWPWERR
jgi:SAM-dependent methyltransferase